MKIAAAVLATLLAAPALAAAPPKAGDPAPSIDVKDVRDRTIGVPEKGTVMLLSFASKSTGETAGDITREVRVQHPEVKILSIIDLSGFPGFMHGIVMKKIKGRQGQAVDDAKAAFKKAGKTPPDDVDALIHIVPDFDASKCKAYGANDTGNQAMLVLVGADGTVKAVFEKTPKAADVEAAVDKEVGSK